jgi:hypothetical protein
VATNGAQVFVIGFDIGENDKLQLLANAGNPRHSGPYYYCSNTQSVPCICHPTQTGASERPAGCVAWAMVPKTTWYVVTNTASIVDAVKAIARSTVSCTLPLTLHPENGKPDSDVLRVRYRHAKTDVLLTPAVDYTLSDHTITLLGNACAALRSAVQVPASDARVEVEMGCACSANATGEICGDLNDNDCDGLVDEGCVAPPPSATCGGNADPADCPSCPDAEPEICDGKDNDCDGAVDEGCGEPVCRPFMEVCNQRDDDCDGKVDEACLRCAKPEPEVCDGKDNDCDGQVDEGCPGAVLL